MFHKRKYDSGCEKRKKKKRIDELTQSQRGSLDKFFIKESQMSENENVVGDSNIGNVNYNIDDNMRINDKNENMLVNEKNISNIREALLEVADSDKDSKIRSEAKSLANNELGDFEFIVAIVIWYDLLYAVNLVSKKLQSKDMLVSEHRENGFSNAVKIVKKLAIDMEIDPFFSQRLATTERSFSKLKLLKSYLRSSMSQERLNGLALVAIENDILDEVLYEDLIDEFASKNARRTSFFK
ncbi:hypothetical protein HRI_004887200 [Hibiscus trionum]|uniref:HAT C-terminal dimerisation domain-containing protein n=1 Tax=Hibiscus trionum TaxID=183268 RepID=A0A9W7JEB8_HIBTR|nr:hypothetical protein HRI_004887200 [Hibiscus trionum]